MRNGVDALYMCLCKLFLVLVSAPAFQDARRVGVDLFEARAVVSVVLIMVGYTVGRMTKM